MSPESRQQLIALVLGIVFIVGFVFFAQRLGTYLRSRSVGNKIASETITPTPEPIVSVSPIATPTPAVMVQKPIKTGTMKQQPSKIPQTGMETAILPLIAGGFGAGLFLRTRKPR